MAFNTRRHGHPRLDDPRCPRPRPQWPWGTRTECPKSVTNRRPRPRNQQIQAVARAALPIQNCFFCVDFTVWTTSLTKMKAMEFDLHDSIGKKSLHWSFLVMVSSRSRLPRHLVVLAGQIGLRGGLLPGPFAQRHVWAKETGTRFEIPTEVPHMRDICSEVPVPSAPYHWIVLPKQGQKNIKKTALDRNGINW